MKKSVRLSQFGLRVCGWLAASALAATALGAQSPAPRIGAEVSGSAVTPLKGSLHPLALPQYDSGRVPANTQLTGVSLVFSRTAAQQAALESLIAAQQDPHSPLFHAWLTPDQFAARFGMAPSDIQKVQAWLEQYGLTVSSVARSQNMIRFSGSVGQVEQAFATQIHYYSVGGVKHFAPSTALSVPSALASVVLAVRNLDDFKPTPMLQRSLKAQVSPAFTSSQTGNVYFSPGDIKLAYGVNTQISAGNTGADQSIAVMGQSAIVNSDIENFENAAGLAVKDPIQVLVPGSGSSEVFQGDEAESDIDVEWSGGIAPGAQIFFVYTGNGNGGVFDSLAYAVDEKIGNIISFSYGQCEPALSTGEATSIDSVLQQATAQGQTFIASSGDTGSSSCYISPTSTSLPLATQEELAVGYPASSQYATGVGGTAIVAADGVDPTTGTKGADYSTYWTGQGSTDETTSLLQYIPEVAWNDDLIAVQGAQQSGATPSLSASTGGASILYTSKPTWQTGVPGIPNDNARDVPDVAFYASPDLPGYLLCTSDQSFWGPQQTGSCGSGFRASATDASLTVGGGTSFAAPIFAGMVGILNQAQGYVSGQGFLNPMLYSLASNSTNYTAIFHDVTTGNNECPSSLGSTFCSAASEGSYATTTGYDQVTGLGSINLGALVPLWPAASSPLIGTTTALVAATATPSVGVNDVVTITVASDTGATTPTGTVNLSVDGGTSQALTLTSNGTVTYTANFTTASTHTLVAQYAGDTTHAASTGALSLTAQAVSSGKGTFTFAFNPTTLTLAQGAQGTESLTITPAGGYTGTINFSVNTSNNTALANLCIDPGTGMSSTGAVAISSATPVTAQLTLDANGAQCSATGAAKGGSHAFTKAGATKTSKNNLPANPAPFGVAFAGLLFAGFLARRSRKLRGLAAVVGLLAIGFGLSACGSGTVNTTVPNPPQGTYTITLTGTDSATPSITSSSSFTLTIN